MSRRKTARSIQNARLRQQARGDIERKRAEQRAIQSKGGQRQPSREPGSAAHEAEAIPESGVDGLEALVDSEADDLERAISDPDAANEKEITGAEKFGEFIEKGSGGGPEAEAGD